MKWRNALVYFETHRCLILLLALLALLALYPYAGGDRRQPSTAIRIISTIMLVATLAPTSRNRRQSILAMAVLIPAVVGIWLKSGESFERAQVLWACVHASYLLMITGFLLNYVVRSHRVTGDRLAGALCGYLMIGIVFSWAFELFFILDPDSFTFTSPGRSGAGTAFARSIYFSFTTLTTMGYGDIVPAKASVQSLAIMEAVTGVLYVASFLAWIMGAQRAAAYGSGRRRRHHEGSDSIREE